jgi:hypothetical protein
MRPEPQTHERDLFQRTDEILFFRWDPIQMSHFVQARDEYHSYLPHVYRLLVDRAPAQAIADYLCEIETRSMGLSENQESGKHALHVANILIEIRDWLDETAT